MFLINSSKSFYKGFQIAYNMPTLPDHIIKFTMHPFIRIFRVISGISFLTMISKNNLHLNNYIYYIVIFISILFTIYHFYLVYHRIKHIIFLFKSNALEIKNSSLDRFDYLSAKAIMFLKGIFELVYPFGLVLGLMIAYDEILKNGNNQPIFMPFLGSILKTILPYSENRENLRLLKNSIAAHTNNNVEILINESLLERLKSLNIKGIFTNDECFEMTKLIIENQEQLKSKNSELKSKILELLDKI